MKATLEDIFAAIRRERQYQTRKWGSVQEHPHEVASYCVIMQGELDEAMQAWRKGRFGTDDLREVLQVVAVGVACLEQHGIVEREELAAIENKNDVRCPWCSNVIGTTAQVIIHLVMAHEFEDEKLVRLVKAVL